jgi:hypothetical protein
MTKIPASLLKNVYVAYIYADGHMILWHRKTDRKTGINYDYATIHKTFPAALQFSQGVERLVVSAEAVPMLASAKSILAEPASTSRGSQCTKEKGIAVATLGLNYGKGYTYIYLIPELISGDIQIQNKYGEKWDDIKDNYRWGDMDINRKDSTYE